MSDLIRREDVMKELNAQFAVGDITREIANDILIHIPSAEPEYTKGYWMSTCYGLHCSVCNYKCETTALPNICPSCGADMRGEK